MIARDNNYIFTHRRFSIVNLSFISGVDLLFVGEAVQRRIYEIDHGLATDSHIAPVHGSQFWICRSMMEYDETGLEGPETDICGDERRSITGAVDSGIQLLWSFTSALAERKHGLLNVSVFPSFRVLVFSLATPGRHGPIVTTWHEVWREHRDHDLGYLPPVGKAIERMAANSLQNSAAMLILTASHLSQIGLNLELVEVVPNCIDTERLQNTPGSEDGYDVLLADGVIQNGNVDIPSAAYDGVAAAVNQTLGIINDYSSVDSTGRTREYTLDTIVTRAKRVYERATENEW